MKNGFTLVEMSIVLVIIGLVIGGILVGQELVNASTIRKTITELQQFNSSVRTFQSKYDCLPGDCNNATDFFGTDATCPAGSTTITGTCNGNGDGIVSINLNAGGHPTEDSYALNQLYFAGLIAGKYPAGPGSNSCCKTLVMGTRVPVSVYSPNIGYQLATMPTSNFLAQNIPVPARNRLVILTGAINATWPDLLYGAGMIAPDALKIDTKLDDALPATGNFTATDAPYVSASNPNTTCKSGSSYSTATGTGCTLYYNVQ